MREKIKKAVAVIVIVVIPILVFVFGEGVFWRFFPQNEDQVTPSATPYNTPAVTEVASNNASDDGGDEVMPPVIQPGTTDNVVTSKATSADSQIIPIETIQTNTTSSGLSLFINDCQYFYNGFYYRAPETDSSYSYIEYDQGISGHFSYSRELTDIESAAWGHNGEILDMDGNELDIDASFYATTDGVFAVELPEDMPSGTYTYLLYLFVHDEYCEARIPFTW